MSFSAPEITAVSKPKRKPPSPTVIDHKISLLFILFSDCLVNDSFCDLSFISSKVDKKREQIAPFFLFFYVNGYWRKNFTLFSPILRAYMPLGKNEILICAFVSPCMTN